MSEQSPYRVPGAGPSLQVVVTTGEIVPGFDAVQVLGVVRGISVPKIDPGTTAHRDGKERLWALGRAEHAAIDEARRLGAQAIIGMRYHFAETFVVAYGTAVQLAIRAGT